MTPALQAACGKNSLTPNRGGKSDIAYIYLPVALPERVATFGETFMLRVECSCP